MYEKADIPKEKGLSIFPNKWTLKSILCTSFKLIVMMLLTLSLC